MQKISHILISLAIVSLLAAPPWVGDATADMPTMQELIKYLGYSEDDGDKLLSGEIISRGLEAGSEKELAVTIGLLVRAPLSEVVEFARSGEIFKVNRDISEFRDLGDKPPDKNDFIELGFDAKEAAEVAKLLEIEPGDTFNLSKSEIDRFKGLSRRFKSKEAQNKAVREAVNAEYRAVLMARYKAYRQGGLGAIAEYDRGGKQSSPGKELTDEAKRGKLMQEKMPQYYGALLNYPRQSAHNVKSQFFWIKQTVNKRPAFILAHRMFQYQPGKYVVATFREFYVGHSYNSLHIVVGALAVNKDTVLFYLNRTSTDQVTGFGGGMKRKIGSKMLRDQVVEQFTEIRKSVQKGDSQK